MTVQMFTARGNGAFPISVCLTICHLSQTVLKQTGASCRSLEGNQDISFYNKLDTKIHMNAWL